MAIGRGFFRVRINWRLAPFHTESRGFFKPNFPRISCTQEPEFLSNSFVDFAVFRAYSPLLCINFSVRKTLTWFSILDSRSSILPINPPYFFPHIRKFGFGYSVHEFILLYGFDQSEIFVFWTPSPPPLPLPLTIFGQHRIRLYHASTFLT